MPILAHRVHEPLPTLVGRFVGRALFARCIGLVRACVWNELRILMKYARAAQADRGPREPALRRKCNSEGASRSGPWTNSPDFAGGAHGVVSVGFDRDKLRHRR